MDDNRSEKTKHLEIPIPATLDHPAQSIPQALQDIDARVWGFIEALQKRADLLEAAVKELQHQSRQ